MNITITVKGEKETKYNLNQDRIIIGRGSSCDITLNSPGISRSHLQFSCEGKNIFVENISGSNWAKISDEKMEIKKAYACTKSCLIMLPGKISLIVESTIEGKDKEETLSSGFEIDDSFLSDSHPKKMDYIKPKRKTASLKLEKKVSRHFVIPAMEDTPVKKMSARQMPIKLEKPVHERKKPKIALYLILVLITGSVYFFRDEIISSYDKMLTKQQHEASQMALAQIKKTLPTVSMAKIEFEENIHDKNKCAPGAITILCDRILDGRKAYEGIIKEGKRIIIYADFDHRLISFFKDHLHQLDKAKSKKYIKALIAAFIYMDKKIMKSLEKAKIEKMDLNFFTINNHKINYEGTFSIETSRHRRFSKKQLDFIFKEARNKLNFIEFEKKILKLIQEKN